MGAAVNIVAMQLVAPCLRPFYLLIREGDVQYLGFADPIKNNSALYKSKTSLSRGPQSSMAANLSNLIQNHSELQPPLKTTMIN